MSTIPRAIDKQVRTANSRLVSTTKVPVDLVVIVDTASEFYVIVVIVAASHVTSSLSPSSSLRPMWAVMASVNDASIGTSRAVSGRINGAWARSIFLC